MHLFFRFDHRFVFIYGLKLCSHAQICVFVYNYYYCYYYQLFSIGDYCPTAWLETFGTFYVEFVDKMICTWPDMLSFGNVMYVLQSSDFCFVLLELWNDLPTMILICLKCDFWWCHASNSWPNINFNIFTTRNFNVLYKFSKLLLILILPVDVSVPYVKWMHWKKTFVLQLAGCVALCYDDFSEKSKLSKVELG